MAKTAKPGAPQASAATAAETSEGIGTPEPVKLSYPVLSPLKHDGTTYGPGIDNPIVKMLDTEARVLIDTGILGQAE